MGKLGFCLALQFGNDSLRKHFSQLNTPLVEGVYLPDCPLRKDGVFIESDELTECRRGKLLEENRIRGTIAFEDAVGHETVRRSFRFNLIRSFSKGERLRLRANVGDEDIMVTAERIKRLDECDEIARDESRALMDQLIEGMLAIGAGFAPINWPRREVHFLSIESHVFAIALHRELLEIRRKAL